MRYLFSLLRSLAVWLGLGVLGLGPTMGWAQSGVWRGVVAGAGIGGTGRLDITRRCVDGAGNHYLFATFRGAISLGSTTLDNSQGHTAFVAKMGTNGQWAWAQPMAIGDVVSSSTTGAIGVDGAGNVYVTSVFDDSTVTIGSTTLRNTLTGGSEILVAKLTSAGQWQWAVKAGGAGNDYVTALTVDAAGNLAIGGYFGSPGCRWATFGSQTVTTSATYFTSDLFVARLNTAGQWQWVSQSLGCASERLTSLAWTAGGNLVIGGGILANCGGTNPTSLGTTALYPTATSNTFVAQLAGTGLWTWATMLPESVFGGYYYDFQPDVTSDASGRVYALQRKAMANNPDRFLMAVSQFSATGQYQWTSPWVQLQDGELNDVLASGSTVYVSGIVGSPMTFGNLLVNAGYYNVLNNDAFDGLVAGLDVATGQWQWAIPTGNAAGYDKATNLGLASNGDVLVAGNYKSSTMTCAPFSAVSPTPTLPSYYLARLGLGTGAAPTITGFSPVIGGGGNTLTVTGTNLTGATNLYVNFLPASNVVANAAGTQLTATVPASTLANVTGRLNVVTPRGWGQSATDFTFVPPPTITAYTPASGPAGTTVLITGAYYVLPNTMTSTVLSVKIGTTSVPFTLVPATPTTPVRLSVTVPAGATSGKITVTTYGGTKTTNSSFTVTSAPTAPTITSFSPASGAPGTTVTINGTNFTGATSVQFGGVRSPFTVNAAGTQIIATVANGACTGTIAVISANGTGTSATSFGVPPQITNFSPAYGPPGTSITLNGNSLAGATAVKINGVSAAFTATCWGMTITAPTTPTSGPISVTTAQGTVSSLTPFTVVPPLQLAVTSATGIAAGQQVVLPVKVSGFQSLLALQGSLQFDTTRLALVAVEQPNAALGLSTASFGTAQANLGRVSFGWFSATNTATTLPANTVLFALRLVVHTALARADTAWVRPTGVTPPLEAVRADGLPITRVLTPGSVRITAGTPVAVSGWLSSNGGQGLLNVPMTATISSSAHGLLATKPAPTAYSFASLVGGQTYRVVPAQPAEAYPAAGVTVADLLLMQRHVLGTALLGNAYHVIAADVDKSSSVTMADVALVQQMVLGSRTTFPKGRRWQFVRADQAFANVNAPWPFDTARTYAPLAASVTGQDFVGCKLGDVNGTWRNADANPRPAPGTPRAQVVVQDAQGRAGGRVRVPVTVSGPAAGVQLTLAWPTAALRLVGVRGAQPGVVVGAEQAGRVSVLWTQAGTATGGGTLLELEFEAVGPAGTVAEVTVTDEVTALLACDAQARPLMLEGQAGTVTIGERLLGLGTDQQAGWQLWPNPAHSVVRVTGLAGGAVELVDGLGRLVRTAEATAGATTTLDVRGLPAGLYTVRAAGQRRQVVINN